MDTIKYSTGRTYNGPQVLQITIESRSTDEFGIDQIVATFHDESRNIKGRTEVLVFGDGIGASILSAYDAGRYNLI